MQPKPKTKTLLTLGAISLVCSRTIFFFVNDPEGPNLLIVVVLAVIIFIILNSKFMFKFIKNYKIQNSEVSMPEIRILSGRFIDNVLYSYINRIEEYKDSKAPGRTEMVEAMRTRKESWQKEGVQILSALQKITGLTFYQNVIDVYLVGGWHRAFSDPLVISIKIEGETFVDVLTHELIHRLLTDNKQDKNGGVWCKKNYPDIADPAVSNHILVHAIHKEIYLNVLKRPDRLAADIEKCEVKPAYKEAWEIVEKEGYMNIVNKFKEFRGI